MATVLGMGGAEITLGAETGRPGTLGPLLEPWGGPHGGIPPFDRVRVEDFKPAIAQGMDLMRNEITALTSRKTAPSFKSVVEVFEDLGRPLGRAQNLLGVYTAGMNDKAMQAVETELAPVLAAFGDEIVQNTALFQQLKAVYDGRAAANLKPDQLRLVETHYARFARQGAALDGPGKARLAEINQRLASLFTTFRQNQLGDEEEHTLVVETEDGLAGLPEPVKASAAEAAKERGLPGKWVFTNTRSSMEPLLVFAASRALREKGWRMWVNRGNNGDSRDNNKVASEILRLRAERARLLGYPTHAHWIVEDNMAGTPEAAMALVMRVWKAAVARAREEIADMQRVVDAEGGGFKIEPWDYRHYAEKVRKAKYDIDQNEVKAHLQLEKMVEGMFWAAGRVYGLRFVELKGVPVFHPDVRVYDVRRGGRRVGLFYFDPYSRPGKNSGAWMSEYRTQERFKETVTPIVSNNSNFVKSRPGEPTLISWDDANTLFHEFGHALHGLLSNVTYPTLAGTSAKRDFVEFPSQVNEYWLETPELLQRFAIHFQTGKPIPKTLVDRVLEAKNFNQGFDTVEYLASAIYDMRIHLAATPNADINPSEFEQTLMAEIGCPKEIVMRHRPTAFAHIFSSDAYSSGYYVYIWADAMTADVYEGFLEKGGLYDKDACKLLEKSIMSVGNSIPPDEAFRRFRGRDVDTNALMRDRGFPVG